MDNDGKIVRSNKCEVSNKIIIRYNIIINIDLFFLRITLRNLHENNQNLDPYKFVATIVGSFRNVG